MSARIAIWGLFVGILISMGPLTGCSETERTLTIVYSNDMLGEIRSCGCAAKDFGGLGRRATFLEAERRRSRNMLVLEGGDFFGADINYGQEKAALTLEAMAYMDYDGIVPGEKEFGFGIDFLIDSLHIDYLFS